MDNQRNILVIGTGHLADMTTEKLKNAGFLVGRIKSKTFQFNEDSDIQEESLTYAEEKLKEGGVQSAVAACIVDNDDAVNMHIMLATMRVRIDMPVFVSLLNDTLSSCAGTFDHEQVRVINPTILATPVFIRALTERISRPVRRLHTKNVELTPLPRRPKLIYVTFALIFAIMSIDILFFVLTEPGMTILKAYYFFVGEVTSFSFNDVSVVNYDPVVYFFRTTLLWATFSVVPIGIGIIAAATWSYFNEVRLHGRRRYHLKNHVVICGLGNLGHHLVTELRRQNRKILVIEQSMESPFIDAARTLGAKVMIADATLQHVLENAAIHKAEALISAVDDDDRNLIIGLNARALQPDIRLILRIFDGDKAKEIRDRFDIQFAYSMSDITSDRIVDDITKLSVVAA
ncbi:NAD-binding protein [Candidatus Jorgensenbacteria bacterium]|nr:NAD-binding protein [Candidatus Jorgensenbacteria bacterium]